jgi:hypothetical protein
VKVPDPEGWVAAAAGVVAVGLGFLTYRNSRSVNWEAPESRGARVSVKNLGPGVAKDVVVEVSGARLSWPPVERYSRVDPGSLITLGTFPHSRAHVAHPTVTLTWGPRWRRKSWSAPVIVDEWPPGSLRGRVSR